MQNDSVLCNKFQIIGLGAFGLRAVQQITPGDDIDIAVHADAGACAANITCIDALQLGEKLATGSRVFVILDPSDSFVQAIEPPAMTQGLTILFYPKKTYDAGAEQCLKHWKSVMHTAIALPDTTVDDAMPFTDLQWLDAMIESILGGNSRSHLVFVSFESLCYIMEGEATFGIGRVTKAEDGLRAAELAIQSLEANGGDISEPGVRILVNTSADLRLIELAKIVSVIEAEADEDVPVAWGNTMRHDGGVQVAVFVVKDA